MIAHPFVKLSEKKLLPFPFQFTSYSPNKCLAFPTQAQQV